MPVVIARTCRRKSLHTQKHEQAVAIIAMELQVKSNSSPLIGFTMIAALSCSNVEVIKTGSTVTVNLPRREPSEIVIYRSTKPEWKFEEIGVVSVRNINRINEIYEVMRIKAGEKGADAIIGFKLESEKQTVPVTKTKSNSRGESYITTEFQTQISYTATGTLIHKRRKTNE